MSISLSIQLTYTSRRRAGSLCATVSTDTGACQGSCRLIHAASGCISDVRECILMIESRSGLRATGPTGDQLRVVPDQRAG